ncbi:hypothetical protein PHYSODRAFT_536295 [Phytophthora sojae]|uniref:FYVE-type domain-containing protein n=1 Tax=Phytophthora sojae (strain P6497) TaxID=1094619 RepID=G5AIZ1_PHYSP|nr:hypothetical protein PHYSODRAFT_536295 [Phytophthora sojae]EGZ04489.1 hypothetical protein PHYSODRAFT_536295 [Phytophthora sojae]|eukprot:XP_009540042.1 hypothetical protein PHYSODRAFT_536295 [Phytophthora sojae]
MDRMLSSPTKQKALVRLMSSDPSLLNGLDDDLLSSITLLSDPPKRGYDRRPAALVGSRDVTERKTIQLYPEDASFATEKKTRAPTPMLLPGGISNAKRAALARANTVLLSPSSNAAAVAATMSSKQDGRMTSGFSMSRSTFTPVNYQEKPPPLVLLDDSMLSLVDGGGSRMKTRGVGSTKKKAKRARRRERKKNSTSSSSGSGSSTNNSEDESYHQKTTGTGSRASVDGSTSAASDIFVTSARKACYVCLREFRVLRKRHICRMCGEVICSRCSVFREVNLPVIENKFRICSCCFVAYRKRLEEETGHQNQEEVEAGATDPTSDNSPDHRESAATEAPPRQTSPAILQDSPSLSPSDNTSDHSSSRNTMNTMSDYSFSSDTPWDMANFSYSSFSSGSRNMEEELEAVLKAKQLEKEVEASQQRIQALEAQIVNQESQQDLLSTEQQLQLQEARATIKLLQEQLRLQEINARQAAYNRDSICLSKLRQTELYANEDDESEALKKKLKVLERQLKQAGISVAEVIPYELAKKKVAEISKRLQEIGSSEVVLENKQAQAAARKEYYILEQEMEKYHMALVMTDEYIEEQRRQEQEWEDGNRVLNLKALRLLRSAIPVNIAKLSERELIELVTPTGVKFPAELARRIKRTNALQLLRTDPKTIAKMHPSVIDGYRTTGLTLLERRALHVVLQDPFHEWKKQQKDEMAQKKFAWYCKLKEAFVTAATNFHNHCESSDSSDSSHTCKLLGLSCPVRAEEKIRKLYCGLGFTTDAEFIQEDILKSEPEGAGEKALLEAQAHAREMVANQRQRDLKAHYKMNMRQVAQAIGALEEMDSILEHVREIDDSFPVSGDREQLRQCNALLNNARDLMLLLAKRVGICITGKRDPAKDEEDTRSPVEIREASRAINYLQEILADVNALLFSEERASKSVTAAATMKAVQELVDDVQLKNEVAMAKMPELSPPQGHPASLSTSALLFDAIKARRKQSVKRADSSDCGSGGSTAINAVKTSKPMDLMAAIRARKRAQSNASAEDSVASTTIVNSPNASTGDAAKSA